MFKIIIEGFKSQEQLEEFYSWYSGQGEQDSALYFEAHSHYTKMTAAMVDNSYIPFVKDKSLTFVIKPIE